MTTIAASLRDFIDLCTAGRTLDAIERWYAEDVVVFENNELSRAGRLKALEDERAALASQPTPPLLKANAFAANEEAGVSFVAWTVRYVGRDERPMRIEEVAMQRWVSGRIVEERFFYEGAIDEGEG